MRSQEIHLRLSEEDHTRWREAASKIGVKSLSAYIRAAVNEKAAEDLGREPAPPVAEDYDE
jgi:predicted HicB family RNase H-like nuclease